MRGLEETTTSVSRLTSQVKSHFRRAWDGFIDFAARDNVLEVALGLIIAQAFTSVVNSFVSDMILPIVSLLPFLHRNMSEEFTVLAKGPHYAQMHGYNTLEQAREDGALVLAYGWVAVQQRISISTFERDANADAGWDRVFLEKVIDFLGISLTLYAFAEVYTLLSRDKIIKRSVKCRYCRKRISEKALRCVNCSSWQDGREDLDQSHKLVPWLLLLSSSVEAGFLRPLPCTETEDPLFDAVSLHGFLNHGEGNDVLSLRLLGNFIDDQCNQLNGSLAQLSVDARVLGHSVTDGEGFDLQSKCPTLSRQEYPRWDNRTYAVYEGSFPLKSLFLFTTVDATIHVQLNGTTLACTRAHITPYVGSVASRALVGIPLAMMLIVGMVTGALKRSEKRRGSFFRHEADDALRDRVGAPMPGLGPCLHHLQFVFLTGCLTLPYPGFFRAVASKFAWSSLVFANWPVTHQFTYPGVQDGIYAVNATLGLEEMSQYLGSTTASDLWTNSIVNLVLVSTGAAMTILLVTACKFLWEDSRSPTHDLALLRTELLSQMQRVGWSVTRIVLDYFLHPLVVFSLYQMNYPHWFPFHTSIALITVVALAGMLVFTVRYLVRTNRHTLLFHHDLFATPVSQPYAFYALYGVPFVRGLAIGGLQRYAIAQLLFLGACEMFILGCCLWSAHSGLSIPWRQTALALARLVTVCMSFVFVDHLHASERTTSTVAYAILLMHTVVFASSVLLDCLYEPSRSVMCKLGHSKTDSAYLESSKAPVYGIKQLSHRSTRRISFAHLPSLDPIDQAAPEGANNFIGRTMRPSSSGSGSGYGSGSRSGSGSFEDIRLEPTQFFRPPRSQRSVASFTTLPTSAPVPPTHLYCYSNVGGTVKAIELDRLDFDDESHTMNTDYYSQREVDLYYGRKAHAEQRSDPQKAGEASDRPSWLVRLKRGKAKSKTKEKGFEVIRPPRPAM
ncbi:hypothetical protein BDW74DRAFT_176660 [Aspergillus multicolor]|uniref:uncharacterized protein n=1 Tax=Aspergillus multicolor TaxID=41759 RepID=UPI003CCDDE6D